MAAAVVEGIGGVGLVPVASCSSTASVERRSVRLCISSPFRGSGLGRGRSSLRRAVERRQARSLVVLAAKLPSGVEAPKDEPNLPSSLWGFTEKAEVWNSRAAMIGIFGLVILEFIVHRGILSLLGVDVGKGLNLPL